MILAPNQVRAQYSYTSPTGIAYPSSITDSTFSITTGSMSCSSGGGTPPSLFLGGILGNGNVNNRTITDASQYESEIPYSTSDDFLTGIVGLTIPLGNTANKNTNCEELLAIVEAEGFLTMMKSMQDLKLLDEASAKALIYTYMRTTGKKLGLDLKAALVDPELVNKEAKLRIDELIKDKQSSNLQN